MKVLVEGEIHKAISRCEPSKVAVAFIGADWNTFIRNAQRLKAIIISPTFGSNPRAIADLVNEIGWDKVFFLDELHAKTYIGENSAVIGSANLTRNGLGGEGLFELCVEVNTEGSLKKVNEAFGDLKKRSQKQYPTKESKINRLKDLEKIWGAAIANRVVRGESRGKSLFLDFELLGEDHFYVLWYQPADCEYSDGVKAVKSFIQDDLHFAPNDKVEINKWALVWRLKNSNLAGVPRP